MKLLRGLVQWMNYQRVGAVTVTVTYRNGDKQHREFRRNSWIEAWDDAHAWANHMHERFGHRITHTIM